MADEKDDKKKQSLFSKDYQRWLVIGTFYVLLTLIAHMDLIGTGFIIFAALAGWGIMEHGPKLVEISITNYEKKE
jgi:hypothetical protein